MAVDVLILGQGLAGTLLGCELERRGIDFRIKDPGHGSAATLVAAGMVNPITGRRLVKSWRVDQLLPLARETYRELGVSLGIPLWRDFHLRRFFADDRERDTFTLKFQHGELQPYAREHGPDSFWIEGAGQVNVRELLRLSRQRWSGRGWLSVGAARLDDARREAQVVIDCRGAATTAEAAFAFVPWEFAHGEVLEVEVAGLDPSVILNRRHWVLPEPGGRAWVGATHVPGVARAAPTEQGRTDLMRSASGLLGRDYRVLAHHAGVRVTLPDKLPVIGRDPAQPSAGVFNALGAKGVLWAPWLARQWADHLASGAPFDPAVDVGRFVR